MVQFRMVFSCDPISVIGMQRIISVGEIALLLSPLTREFSLRLFHDRWKKKKSVQKYRDRNPRVYVLRSHRVIPRFLTILYLSVCLSDVFTPALKHSRCLRETRLYIYIYSILYTKRLKCNRLPLPLPFRVFASNNKYRDRYFLPPLCENSRERIYPRRMISNSILRKKKKKKGIFEYQTYRL